MTNEEMETLLKKRSAPEKATQVKKPKVAKVSERTHKSLMKKIKDDIKESASDFKEGVKESLLTRAFRRYNKKHAEMDTARKNATEGKKEKENYEVAIDYADVAKYGRIIPKLGVRLLKDDIKAAVTDIALTEKLIKIINVARRLKVPSFLIKKISKVGLSIERFKQIKQIKKGTKEHIKSSIDSALYTEKGLLQDEINQKVISDLGVIKEDGQDLVYSIDSLRKFISKDGKKPMFGDKEEEILERKTKQGSNLPPVGPTSTVEPAEKRSKSVIQEIFSGFEKTDTKEEVSKTETVSEKPLEIATPAIVTEESKSAEKDDFVLIGEAHSRFEESFKKANTEEERLNAKKQYKKELDQIIKNKRVHVAKEKTPEKKVDSIEPIEVTPKKEEKTVNDHVKTNIPVPERATQIASGSTMNITFDDIKKLRERLEADKLEVAKNKAEIEKYTKIVEELREQKATLEQYKQEFGQVTSEKEASAMQASQLKEEAKTLNNEVARAMQSFGYKK